MSPASGPRRSSRIMAAAAAAASTKPRKTTKTKPRRNHYKTRQLQQKKNIQERISEEGRLPSNSCTATIIEDVPKTSYVDFESIVDSCNSSECSTPKAERFRIPEIMSCPPAPKKQRVLSNCTAKRSPIAFFAHPDLEVFFLHASRNIPA